MREILAHQRRPVRDDLESQAQQLLWWSICRTQIPQHQLTSAKVTGLCPNALSHGCFRVGQEWLCFPQVPELRSAFTWKSARISEFKRWGCTLINHQRTTSYNRPGRCMSCSPATWSRGEGMPLSQSVGYSDSPPLDPPSPHQNPTTSLSITPRSSGFPHGIHGQALGHCQPCGDTDRMILTSRSIWVRALSGHQERNEMNERTALPFIYSFFFLYLLGVCDVLGAGLKTEWARHECYSQGASV